MPGWKRVIFAAAVIVCLYAIPATAAHQQPMFFKHLTLQDGLSQSSVMSILQDSQGFIWLGTENGLNRYDGYSIKSYHRDRQVTEGLANDFIWAIAEDLNSDLWLATSGGGVARWNRRTDTFTVFRHDPDDADSLASDSARTLVAGPDGRIWVGLRDAGLDLLDPATGKVVHSRHNAEDPRSLSSNSIFALHLDRAGHLWIGTDAGLNRFNPSSGKFIRYNHDSDDPHSLSSDRVQSLFEDEQGSLWVGTFDGGLNRLFRSSGRFTRYRNDPNDSSSLSDDHVRAIFEDDANRLWVGTSNGLNLFDRRSMTFSTYRHGNRSGSLSDSYVMSIHQDRGGILWIGTRAAGANAWNPRSWSLGHYSADWLEGTNVTSFASDAGSLWVGTFDRGLTLLQDGVPLKTYRAPDITDDRVMSLLIDRQGRLWIGTMEGGLNRLDPATDEIVKYRHDAANPQSLGADGVMSLHEDRAGGVWVGTFGGGLNRYDPHTDGFTRYPDPADPQSLTSPRVTTIVDDLDGFVWIGTDDGLNRLDPVTGSIVQIRHDPKNLASLGADTVYDLHIDNAGTLWIGTAGGGLSQLLESNPFESIEFKNYSQPEGLPSNVVYGVLSDAEGRLWLSTNNGVVRYVPESGRIKTYHKDHGLQGDEFNFGAHHQNAQGVLFFGGANGFNAIAQGALEENSKPPRLVMTKVETLNQPALTTVPYILPREIDIGHEDRMLTFEFAAMDFTSPAQNQYEYFLEGFDSAWISAGPLHRATYTNLDPGKYVFRVKAANSDGVWNKSGLSVDVNVAPAPWLTWWAYAGYGLATLLIIVMLARARWQKLAREKQYRQQLHQLAYFDTLTGIPNRHLFMEHLQEAIGEARSENEKIALLYIDLDQFKRINDTLGHRTGDAVLKLVTERLMEVLDELSHSPAELRLARLGGDEFVVTISEFGDEAMVNHLAQKILDSLSKPLHYQRHELVVTPSIGVSIYPQDGADVSSLLKNADTALYEAKDAGRNGYKFYSPTMNARSLDNLALEEDLRHALETDQLHVVYQPKVDLQTMKIVGAEALLRWTHTDRGDISPDRFIPIAEQTGLILDIDRWVAKTVCDQLGTWQRSGVGIVPVAINLSGREFTRGDELTSMLIHAVKRADIEPRYLELEITEGVLMSDSDAARALLTRLKVIGFQVSVDDFGTGYSSLSYLKGFSLSSLKIDRSFVMDVENDSADQAICSAIISMSHGLGLKVIAEGVETEAQRDFLREKGCDQLQGYLTGRPALADCFSSLLLSSRVDNNLVLANGLFDGERKFKSA